MTPRPREEVVLLIPLLLVFLFPLAVYLLVLASINRRERPVLVSGVWDAVGLTVALAGVYLWIGPAILGTFYERGLLPGTQGDSERRFEEIWTYYPLVWGAYYVLVLVGQAAMILSRRNKTSIYNVDAAALERLVVDCFRRRGYEIAASGNLLVFKHGTSVEITALDAPPTPAKPRVATGAVELDRFDPLRHVTLQWFVDDRAVRNRIEADLQPRLDEATTPENPAASWFMGLSGMMFGLVILGALFSMLVTRGLIR
jgi:hypothetical protein